MTDVKEKQKTAKSNSKSDEQQDTIERIANQWNETTVQFGDTKFEIRKLLPMDAFETFEKVRIAMADNIGDMEVHTGPGSDVKTMIEVVKAVMKIDRDSLASIRDDLFEEIYFSNSHYKSPLKLRGLESTAFASLNFSCIYELLMRAFVVNFSESLSEIIRRVVAKT